MLSSSEETVAHNRLLSPCALSLCKSILFKKAEDEHPIDGPFKTLDFVYDPLGPSFYFDVDEEQVKEMPMPAIPDKSQWRRVEYFGECKGHLYLVEIVKCRIDLDEMITSYMDPLFSEDQVFQIMYIVKGESDDDDGSYLVLRIPTKIIRYNLKDDTVEKLCDFIAPFDPGDGLYYLEPYYAYEYIRSYSCV
ncbi:hypothetical protein JCGZ_26292 [Jatropha curcas]|uniref:Uncharacterized protein n=1 Tax=Jatropha curcas TaxID=180498 RepID=A0A067JEX9_JATCU|nr:hypothetical protein JCGZ_26292 [Jatropha curcas]